MQQTRQQERTQQTPSQGPVSSQPEPNPSMSDAAGPPPAQLPDPPRPQLAVEKKEPRPMPRLRAVVESQAFKNVLVDEMDMMHARAATLIQASWRGHRLRQKLASQVLAAKAIQEAWRRFSTKRLLRSSRAREASAGAENEADIPYHPPRQVRFQPRDGDAPPAPSLPPPVMENKETQFPSSDSLAPCPSEEGSPRTPAARPGGPCPTRAPEVTFLPHQTLAITIPCPVRLEASGQPCVLAETITSSCLVRVEGDTMARLRPSTPRASKAHVLGPVPPGRSLQTPDRPGQGQTQDHENTEVPRAQAQLCPAATMTRTQAQVCPAAAMARTPPQACPTASMTRIQGQVCPVASMTRTCTVAVTAKSPATMYPAALMTRPPAPVYAVAAVPRAPPQACPVATMTRPPPQACPVAAVIRPLPQACPVATTTRPPPQACPVAAVTRPPPQACPVAAVIRPPPQACPVATTTRPPPQACPVAAVTRPPPQACPVAAVTRPPPQAFPVAAVIRPPPQACPVATTTRPPPQACPVAAVTRPPPQARLAAMVTKTPAQLRSVATIFKTLCLTPPAVGSPKCSPQATTPTGVTKNLSPTHLSPPKVVRAMGSERPAAAVLRAPSHSCVATGKAKCPTPPSLDSGFPRAPAEKSRASPQRPVKMDMSQSTGDPPVSRVSSWAKVRAEDECRLQTPTHLKAGTVNVQSHTCLPVHASVPPSQPQMVPAVARGPCQSQPIPGVARGPSQPQPAPGATRGPCQPQLVICQPRPVSGVARGPCQSQPIPRVARGPSQPQPAPGATRGPCQPQLVICQPRPVSGVAKGPYQPQPAPGVMRSPCQPQLVPCQPRPVSGVAKDPCQPQPAPGVTRGPCQPQPALGMTRGPCQPQPVPRQPQPVPSVARGLCQPQPALGVTRGPCQPQPVPRQPQPVPGVARGPCQPQPAPGVVRVPCQVQLAPQVTRTPCQAQVTLCLTRASSQAQLATETTKSHFPAHQAADINKTQSQPHLAGPKASVQACLPLGALSRAKLDDGLARLPPHSHVLGKTTQGPPLAPSDTQGMLVPLLGSAGHPPCHIESWGDSGTTRAPPTHTRSALCQEEAMALQLASLCTELAAALGTHEDLPALLARALSQGEVRAVLAQALSKEASWAASAKPPPHSMLGTALVKALSWGDLSLALCRALSQGDLRAELARAVQDKLAGVLSKVLTEEERAALSQALCQGELGAVLGPSLSQAGLRTAAKAVGGGVTVTPALLEMDCRGRPPATWGPVRPHPIKVRVPQGRVWGALAMGQPAEPLEELGVGVALEGSPCSSMPTVRAPMAARPAATAHQCPLMLGLSPVQAWATQPWGDSLGLSLRPSVASDTAPVVPAPPPLWPLPCLWHLLVANGAGPSTSRPATSASATPSSHKPHVVSRVAPRPRASSGEASSGAGVVGGAGQPRGSGGRGQGVPSHHPAAICSRTACWCQLSRTTKAAPGLYRPLAARGPQRPPMAREEPPRRPPPSPNHKPPSTGLRETVNTVCPGILKASVGGREPPPQPQRGTAAGRPGVSRSQKCIVSGAARAAFKASLGDRPALPHPRASTARQERGHAWIALSTVPCSQQQATDYAMGKLRRLVAGLPQGSDDGLARSISQGSMACSLDPSNSQSSLQSLSTLSPSSLSVASVAAVDLADSWEILDGEVQTAPRLPGEGAWRLQGHKDTDGGENPDNRRAAPSPQQLAPVLEPAPILHHEAASSRVTLSVHWGSENNLAVPLVCNSMSKLEGLSRAPFEQGLVKSLSLGAVVPTRTQPSSPAQQPLASRVAVPSLSHPSVYSRIAPSLAQQYLASGVTPSLSQPGVPKTATASLSHPSVATRLAPSLVHPSVVSAMAYSLAYPSLTSGVAPSLAQPSIAGKVAPSLAQPSIQSGVAPSLAQPSMASGVAPSLAQPSITHRVAPSLAQPSVASGVAPSLAQPSIQSGVAPSLTQPSMASGVAPSLAQPSMASGVAPSLAQPSMASGVAPSLAQPSMASGVAPCLAQPSMASGVAPSLAQPSMASGVAPSLAQPSITHRVAPSLAQPSMASGVAPSLAQPSITHRVAPSLAQPSMASGVAPSLAQPSITHRVAPSLAQPSIQSGVAPSLAQPSMASGVAPSLTQPSVASGVAPSLTQPSMASGVAPSLTQTSMASGVAPSLAQPSITHRVAPSLAQPSITHRVAPSLAQPSIQSGVAPSLAQPSMASGVAPSLTQPSMASGVAPSLTQPSMASGVAPSLTQPSMASGVAPSLAQPSMASGMAPSLAQPALARGVTPILAQPSVASGMTPRRAQPPAARCVAPSLTQPSITHRVAPSLTQPSMTSGMGHSLDHSSLASRMDSHLQSLRVNAMAPSRHHPSVVFEATSDGPYPAHGLGSMGRALSQPSVDTGLGPGPEPLLAGEVGSECSRVSCGFYQPTRIGGEHPSLSPVPGVTLSAPNLYQASRGASGPPQGSGLSQRVLVSGAADGAPQGAMAAAVPLSWSRAPMAGDVAGRSVPPGMALSHSQVAGGTGSLASRISVSGAPLTRASVAAGLGSGCSQAPLAKVSLSSLGPSVSEIRVDLPLPLDFQHPSVATIVAPSYQQANALSQDAAMGAAACLGPGAVTHSPRAASAGRMSGLPPGLVMSGVAPSPPPGSVAALRASTAGGLSTAMPGPAVGSAAQALPQGSMLIGLTPRPYQGTLAGEGSAGGPLLSPFAADPVQGHPQALETVGPAWEVPQVSTPLGRASCLGETPELMLFGAAENPALLMPGELEEVQSLGSESSTPSVVLEATPWTLHDPARAEVAYGPQAPFEEGPPNGPQTPLLGDMGPVSSQAPNLASHPMAPHQRLSTHWGAPSSHWVAAGGVPVMQPRTMLGSATGHLPVPLGLSQGSGPYVEPRGYPQGVMASTAVPRSPWLACSSTTAPCLHPAPGANIGVLSLSQGPGVPSVASHMPPYPPAAREGANGSLQVDTIARVLQEPASPVQGRSQALGPRKTYRSLPGSLMPEMPRGPRRTLVRPYQPQEQGPSLVQGSPQRPRETQLPVGTPILPIGEAVPGPPIPKPAPGARRVSLGYRVSSGSFLRPLPNLPSHQLGSQVSHGVAVPVGHPVPPLTPADAAVAVGCAWGPWDAVGGQVQVAGPRRLGVLLASMQVAEEVRVHAAIVIQAHVRGYLVRRVVEIWHRSATVIQAVWRGHRVRCAIARLQGAVLTVQSLWRGHSARHPCPGLTPPAPCQAAPSGHRCFQACQPHVCGLCRSLSSGLGSPPSVVLLVGSSPRTCHMCGHTWPTRVVQGTGRASAGPDAGPPTLPPPHRAATTIQSAWRGFRTRRKLRQEHMAARTVQATWRGHYTRAHLSTDALLAPGTAWGVPRHVQWPGV
ncbi:IQ domain-containing protein N [Tamandua tetradactyla]|uniref:IQ domain-containing protein N n=1 Tax=Tamandua tetradactyla TaxID=48850 RepID=UPI0040543C7C